MNETPVPTSAPLSFRHYVWQRYFKPFLLIATGLGIFGLGSIVLIEVM